jgi:PKD repeat protein
MKCLNVNFVDLTGNNPNTFLWEFGDGIISTSQNPSHIFDSAGVYDVTFTTIFSGQCTSSVTFPNKLEVFANPIVSFLTDTILGCSLPYDVSFYNNTIGANHWHWDFGDGNTLSDQSATTQQHSYTTNSGSPFTVTLTAKNHNAEVSGSKGSFSTFKWEDMVVVYTNAPIPAFTYEYTQRDTSTVGPASALDTTINVDESTTTGSSQPVTYDVTTSQFTTHWMLSFSDGTTYPSSATTGQTGATLESNWEVYASTKTYAKTWENLTQDTAFTATLYCYSTTTGSPDEFLLGSVGSVVVL